VCVRKESKLACRDGHEAAGCAEIFLTTYSPAYSRRLSYWHAACRLQAARSQTPDASQGRVGRHGSVGHERGHGWTWTWPAATGGSLARVGEGEQMQRHMGRLFRIDALPCVWVYVGVSGRMACACECIASSHSISPSVSEIGQS
jgi:predicted amidohydrolase